MLMSNNLNLWAASKSLEKMGAERPEVLVNKQDEVF